MMDIIAQAARAVRKEMGAYAAGDDLWMVEGGVRSEGQFRDIVRAVLAAMREPSEVGEMETLKVQFAAEIDEMFARFNHTTFYEALAKCHRTLGKIRDLEAALPDPAQAAGEDHTPLPLKRAWDAHSANIKKREW